MKKQTNFLTLSFAIVTVLIVGGLAISCTKSENAGSGGKRIIEVAISDANYESEETIRNRAATPSLGEADGQSTIQRNTIKLNNDFLMVAELRPQDPARNGKNNHKAALDTTNLSAAIRYRVLVYNQAGIFVTERNYVRGQEASTAALALDGGSTYTFVVISFNSTVDLMPAVTPAAQLRTLANSQISQTNTGINDYMYYQQTMTVAGNSTNRLDIVLKHKKPRIDLTINASQTGLNIDAVSANFNPHNDDMLINLIDGTYIQSGSPSSAFVTFPNVGSQIW